MGGVHNHNRANKVTFFITDLILYTMPSWAGFIITTVPIRLNYRNHLLHHAIMRGINKHNHFHYTYSLIFLETTLLHLFKILWTTIVLVFYSMERHP